MRFSVFRCSLTLSQILIVLSLASLGLRSLTTEVAGLHIAFHDFVGLFALLYLRVVVHERIKLSSFFMVSLFIVLLCSAWGIYAVACSPVFGSAITKYLILLRDVILFIGIAVAVQEVDEKWLTNAALVIGVCISIVSLVLFKLFLTRYWQIFHNEALWDTGVGAALDKQGQLRIVGLGEDPNFLAIALAPGLLSGLYRLSKEKWRLSVFLGTLIIGVTLALTQSRSFFVALPLSVVMAAVIGMVASSRARKIMINHIGLLVAVAMLLILAALVVPAGADMTIVESMKKRFGTTSEVEDRFLFWQVLEREFIKESQGAKIGGRGYRSTQVMLHGRYSHSTFLDVLFEQGLVGMLIWLAFLGWVSYAGFWLLLHAHAVPWVESWLLAVIMSLTFSIGLAPILWVFGGVLIGRATQLHYYR